MQYDSGVESQQPLRRNQKRVDVNLCNPGLFKNELTEADQEMLQGGDVHWLASANAFQGGEDSGLLHHSSSESGVEWRKR